MSAYGYKQTCGQVRQRVRFTSNSGHSDCDSALTTSDVRFAPEAVTLKGELAHRAGLISISLSS